MENVLTFDIILKMLFFMIFFLIYSILFLYEVMMFIYFMWMLIVYFVNIFIYSFHFIAPVFFRHRCYCAGYYWWTSKSIDVVMQR